MPVWPKSIYTFGVNLKTAGVEWKLLRKKRAGPALQEKILGGLTRRLAVGSHWKKAGVEAGMTYASFRSRVPLQSPAHLEPAIERMKQGEADVLWPGRCSLFALTAGTTTGQPRHLPVTEELLAHFRRAGFEALLYYNVRVRHAGAFRGRHLFYGGSPALAPIGEGKGAKSYAADLSGIAALNLPAWADKHLYEPGPAIAQMPDWDAQLAALAARTGPRDISLIAALPSWAALIADALREKYSIAKQRITHLQGHWTNLECYVHTGVPIAPFFDELRQVLGPTVTFHEVFAASEGFFAAQDTDAGKGLRLMSDLGIFFEFLPLADFDETRLPHLGSKAVPLADVKAGIDYVMIITTPGGLARYVLGDVVRFLSTEPPRFIYVGRTRLRLNAFEENVSEKDLTDVLVTICRRRGWRLVNFHVAPLPIEPQSPAGLTRSPIGATRNPISATRNPLGLKAGPKGRHEWWIELKPGTLATPTGVQMAADLDVELQRVSPSYGSKRETGVLDAPFVRLVMPGVFEHWLRNRQKWGGQHKTPRCRSDRLIADELGTITTFARD
jgi:hypothetical protein